MFSDSLITRSDLPRDAFQFIRACAFDHLVPKEYRKDARKILTSVGDRAKPKRARIGKSDSAKERAALTKECDALTKKLIIAERGAVCEQCGKDGRVEPVYSAHIKAKGARYRRLRFEKTNLLLLCYHDHIEWAHKEPDDFIQWVEAKWPGRLEMLRVMAATAAKVDLKMLVIVLRAEVAELGIGTTDFR